MPSTRPASLPELRHKIVELIRAERNAAGLAREFEPTESAIRHRIAQADRDAGVRSNGLTTDELRGTEPASTQGLHPARMARHP